MPKYLAIKGLHIFEAQTTAEEHGSTKEFHKIWNESAGGSNDYNWLTNQGHKKGR